MVIAPHEFLGVTKACKNSLSFINLNCRSTRSRKDELDLLFQTLGFQFSAIPTETWYDDGSEMYTPSAYLHFFITRQ